MLSKSNYQINMSLKSKKEVGSINNKEIAEAMNIIGILTNRFKRRKISSEEYITNMHNQLSRLTNQRDYLEYLKNIGQR